MPPPTSTTSRHVLWRPGQCAKGSAVQCRPRRRPVPVPVRPWLPSDLVIPEQYASIATLKNINVSGNALTGAVPGFLGNLRNLRLLYLSQNLFTGEVLPALFENCFRTRFVSFSGNYLSGKSLVRLVAVWGSKGLICHLIISPACFPWGCVVLCVWLTSRYETIHLKGALLGCWIFAKVLEFLDLAGNAVWALGFEQFYFLNASHNAFAGQKPEIRSCSERMGVSDVSGNGVEWYDSSHHCHLLEHEKFGFGFQSTEWEHTSWDW